MEILERIGKIEQNIHLLIQEDLQDIRRIPLMRVPINDSNYLGISLTVVPSELDFSKLFFITFHTVRPQNRINLKKYYMVDEMYGLLKNILELKYTGWQEFFLKHFKPLDIKSKLSRIKFEHQVFDIEEGLEWNKIDIKLRELRNLKFEEVEVQNLIKQEELENMTCEEIEEELKKYLNKTKWEHFTLFKTENLYFILSITKHGTFTFGITTGNPKNYLKFKNYAYVETLFNLIEIFKYLLEKHPKVKDFIINYIR
jgi:hypothetical protein